MHRTQRILNLLCSLFYSFGVRHIECQHKCFPAHIFDFTLGSIEAFPSTSNQCTLALSLPNSRAIARPTPAAAPVTTITRLPFAFLDKLFMTKFLPSSRELSI